MLFKKRGKIKHKISLLKFTIKHTIIKISKYCLYFLLLVVLIFISLWKFHSGFHKKVSNHKFVKKIERVLKKSCYNIKIEGVTNADIAKINFYLNEYCSSETEESQYALENLKNDISQDPWVKIVNIRKELPYSFKIKIIEYKPFAIWKDQEKFHLIDEEGVIIKISEQELKGFYNLLIVTGRNSKDNIKTLFNLLLSNLELTSKIRIADRIGNRRWNLELNNKIIVKLPEDNMTMDSWQRLAKLLSIPGIDIDLKTIDLRMDDKIFLEYKEQSFQEMKKV